MEDVFENSEFKISSMELGPWDTRAYIVTCRRTGEGVLIDAPPDVEKLIDKFSGTRLQCLLLTHGHLDHTAGLSAVRNRLKAPFFVHLADSRKLPFPPEKFLSDGDVIRVGEAKLEVLHTPGHTPGSLCFKAGVYLLSGDTIFPGGPGRTESPADFQTIIGSLNAKVFPLPDATIILPGHGNSTVLKKEKEEFAVFASRSPGPDLCGDVSWLTA